MGFLTIALLQLAPHGPDQAANLDKGLAACRQARALGADVALFPEMWNIGYMLPDPADAEAVHRWASWAMDEEDAFVHRHRELASELEMAIAVTYLQRWHPAPRNVVSLVDRHGDIVLTYAKVHTCDFDREAALTPGDGFRVGTLDTAAGPVQVGAMICMDREFPESARVLMLQGAELILVPNACEMEINRRAQLRARAYENMLAVALTNYPAPCCGGRSVVYDGMAFASSEGTGDGVSRDMRLVEAGEEEGVFLARLDLDALRAYRAYETWGNAYRRPGAYDLLVSDKVRPPFVRPNARR
jgi:predicted amidohydrolase